MKLYTAVTTHAAWPHRPTSDSPLRAPWPSSEGRSTCFSIFPLLPLVRPDAGSLKKTLAWASPRAQGSRQRHAITLLGRAWPRIMSMVRFLTPRPFFGSNRRLSSTSSQNGILRVPWPSIFNFLPKRSLIRRKPPRNDRGRGLSYTRCFASLGARLFEPCIGSRPLAASSEKKAFF